MSQDISLYAEIKHSPIHEWEMLGNGEIHVERDYRLFSCLMGRSYGINNKIGAIPARGIPDDISEDVLKSLFVPIGKETLYKFPEGKCLSVSMKDAEIFLNQGGYKVIRGYLVGDSGFEYSWINFIEFVAMIEINELRGLIQGHLLDTLNAMERSENNGYSTRFLFGIG